MRQSVGLPSAVTVWAMTATFLLTSADRFAPRAAMADDRASRAMVLSEDFGETDPGGPVEWTFKVENPSRHAIQILDHRSSCGCLEVLSWPRVLDPGESGVVRLSLDTEGLYGRTTKSVVFKLDHPEYRAIQLQLTGLVHGVWTIPRHVEFGSVTSSEPVKREFLVVASGLPSETRVERVSVDHAFYQVKVEPASLSDDDERLGHRALAKVVVTSTGDHTQLGAQTTKAKIVTSDAKFPEAAVTLSAHLVGDYKVSPSPVVFGHVPSNEEMARTCTIRAAAGGDSLDAAELTIHSDNEAVLASFLPSAGSDSKLRLRLVLDGRKIPSADMRQLQKGTVTILKGTDPVLSIPYIMFLNSATN